MDPTIASNNIIEVNTNHIEQLVYIILPILIMSETSTIFPSQLLDETKKTESENGFISLSLLTSMLVLGKILLNGMKKAKIVNIAKGMLLLVSLMSSDTLMLININMNKNKIDTAPTYTSKYDKPINFIPIIIKQQDILANKEIRNKTDTTGFFDIIINIPDNIHIIAIISNTIMEQPLYKSGMTCKLNNNFILSLTFNEANELILKIKIRM